ncbi:MAG: hypothetical protein HXL39_05560 [Schaalia sp.]|nr:hypothetical protein [Schaalia sp.]
MSVESPEFTRSIDYTTPTEGLGIVDELYNVAQDLRAGEVNNLVDSAKAIYEEAAGLAVDPIGGLVGMAVEWILQHVDPLKTWVNQLTGDSAQVYGMSSSWDSISSSLASVAEELQSTAEAAMSGMQGEAVRAYLERQAVVYSAIDGVSAASGAFGEALSKVADSVDSIHDAVVGAIGDVVGSCVSAAAEVVFSLGLAAPVAEAQVASKVAKWVGLIGPVLDVLMEAVQAIMAIYAVMTSVGENLTRGVEHIGEQCQAPGGGCCGEGHSKGGVSDGRNVHVDGDNNGTIVNGDVNIEEDNHTEINPSIELSPEINIENEHEEKHHHHYGRDGDGDDDSSHRRKRPHEQPHNGSDDHGTRPRKQHGGNHDSGNDGNHHRRKGGSSHDGGSHHRRRSHGRHR